MEKRENTIHFGEQVRIVIVEDNPDIRALLTVLIQQYGYSPCGEADNGMDAIRLIKKTLPDIVFIDIVLGGSMNGVELADHINKEFRIPFVYITGYTDEQRFEQAIQTFPAAFIVKPFKGEEIRGAVERIMNHIHAKKHGPGKSSSDPVGRPVRYGAVHPGVIRKIRKAGEKT